MRKTRKREKRGKKYGGNITIVTMIAPKLNHNDIIPLLHKEELHLLTDSENVLKINYILNDTDSDSIEYLKDLRTEYPELEYENPSKIVPNDLTQEQIKKLVYDNYILSTDRLGRLYVDDTEYRKIKHEQNRKRAMSGRDNYGSKSSKPAKWL